MTEVLEKTVEKTRKPKMYSITFHSGEGKEEAEDVVIGWNCKLNRYKRNVKTTIDENFLGVLKDAVIHTKIKDLEKNTEVEVTIPRFSYTVEPL